MSLASNNEPTSAQMAEFSCTLFFLCLSFYTGTFALMKCSKQTRLFNPPNCILDFTLAANCKAKNSLVCFYLAVLSLYGSFTSCESSLGLPKSHAISRLCAGGSWNSRKPQVRVRHNTRVGQSPHTYNNFLPLYHQECRNAGKTTATTNLPANFNAQAPTGVRYSPFADDDFN